MKDSDKIVQNSLLIALFLGIIISVIVFEITKIEPEAFTELYFPNHAQFPEDVDLFTNYTFSYTLASHEDQQVSHEIETKVELYNIYDITEGTYKCIGRILPKVRLKWFLENETTRVNLSKYESGAKLDERFTSLRTVYIDNESATIPWDEYYLQFSFRPSYDTGLLIVNITQLTLVFDVSRNVTVLETDGRQKEIKTPILAVKDNSVLMHFSGEGVSISLNDKEIAAVKMPLTERILLLKQINNYFTIGSLSAYVDKPFSVRAPETIREYEIDGHELNQLKSELTSPKTDKIVLSRRYYNPSWYELLSNIIGNEVIEMNYTQIPSHVTFSRDNISWTINWTDYELSFKVVDYGGRGQIGILMKSVEGDNIYGFLFQRKTNDAFFFQFLNETRVNLTFDPYVKQDKEREFRLIKNLTHAIVIMNDQRIFEVPLLNGEEYVNLTFFSTESSLQVSSIEVSNLDPKCGNPLYFGNCRKEYSIGQPVRRRGSSNKIESSTLEFSPRIAQALQRMTEIGEINYSAIEELKAGSEQEINYSQYLQQQFVYDLLDENITGYNPVIPDKKFVFDGPTAKISNWNNYEFKIEFVPLDGALIIGIGFLDSTGEELYKLLLSLRDDKAYLIRGDDIQEREIDLFPDGKQTLVLRHENGQAVFKYDFRSILFTVPANYSTGYFAFETYNTYATVGQIKAKNLDTKAVKQYRISDNPCQLRLVGEKYLGQESISLRPGEQITLSKSFNFKQDFDFGKISATLKNRNQTIYYWVTRK